MAAISRVNKTKILRWKNIKEVKWIYYCKPTDAYIYSCDDRGRFESEEEAIKWCEEKANKYRGISFEYSKSCYVPLK